ncbi:MAG: radical SAM protein [Planctomycetales bacterium]|nr:radical SAM protein [Planctomycetales bacterium]
MNATAPLRVSRSLRSFNDSVVANDDHASYRLALIAKAEALLESHSKDHVAERRKLADRLERWRYQRLRELLDEGDRDDPLLDALDDAARRLAGRAAAEPRRTLAAVRDHSDHLGTNALQTFNLARACEALDPHYPLAELEARAAQLTADAFGVGEKSEESDATARTMRLYAPLYLSSHCVNHCTYCGFRFPLDVERRHLSLDEIERQIDYLQGQGFRHLLVVGGDYPQLTTTGYYCAAISALRRRDLQTSVEIEPQSTASYQRMVEAGADGVTLYQETYDAQLYREYHPRGPKADFSWRLEGLDRAAEAGMRRLGLGVLLGLAPPASDLLALARHGRYLAERYAERRLAFSLPRIHEAPAGFVVRHRISDEFLVRSYCVLRLAFPTAQLVLSTRESASLRSRLGRICVTQMSAGSSTTPGGYGNDSLTSVAQFPITDQRSPAEVANALAEDGFRVLWGLDD